MLILHKVESFFSTNEEIECIIEDIKACLVIGSSNRNLKNGLIFCGMNNINISSASMFVLLFIGVPQEKFDSVLIGLAPDKFNYNNMNEAFR